LRDLGINRRAATPYAVNGVYKSVTSENPVLEQVTDRLRRLLEELHRVPRLDVLREYEHAHFGVFSTYPLRCKRSLVFSGGQHTDVGDDHVRRLGPHELQEYFGVRGLGGHLEAVLGQESGHPSRNSVESSATITLGLGRSTPMSNIRRVGSSRRGSADNNESRLAIGLRIVTWQGVGLHGVTVTERTRFSLGGVLDRLLLGLGIDLCPEQRGEGRQP
jgi:hypothetical protein